MDFTEKLVQSIEDSVLSLVRKGDWITIPYEARAKIDPARIREMYGNVDWKRVMELARKQVEENLADKIVASLATELATDVKSIMSNRELREDIRATLREMVRKGATESKTV